MRGVVCLGNRRVELREFPDPEPGPGEVVVRIGAAGLCGSDLHAYRGERAQTHISGHEPCGTIAALGAGVTGWRAGERVIVHHYAGCGQCKYCRIGYDQLCLHGHRTFGFGAHGANADFLLVPARCLVRLPDALSFAEGAAIACGTGTAYMALTKLGVSGRDTLAIYGQGPVGLSATLLGKAMGARVIAVEVAEPRRALARELGADVVLDPQSEDPVAAIRELTGGGGGGGNPRLHRPSGRAGAGGAECTGVRPSLLRGGRRDGDPGAEPGYHPPPPDPLRVLDFPQRGLGRMRAVDRRAGHSPGSPDHAPLPPGGGRGGLPDV